MTSPAPSPPPAHPGDSPVSAASTIHLGAGAAPTVHLGAGVSPTVRLGPGAATPDGLPRRIGRWNVARELGRGGFGVVYEGIDPRERRVVAIKVVLERRSGPDDIERFLREARSTAKLRHPAIVRIHETGVFDGKPFMAMDLVVGVSLEDRLREPTPPPRSEVIEVVRQAAEALAYAHARGVIHRDVKPENLMVDGRGAVRVMDFGLSLDSEESERLTRTGFAVGSPAYMAPEQACDERHLVGPKTDVWGLGVVLYQGLCGQNPFAAANLATVLKNIVAASPPRPSSLVPDLDPRLDAIVAACIAKEPGGRPTAAQLAAALRAIGGMSEAIPPAAGPVATTSAAAEPSTIDLALYETDAPTVTLSPTRTAPTPPPPPTPTPTSPRAQTPPPPARTDGTTAIPQLPPAPPPELGATATPVSDDERFATPAPIRRPRSGAPRGLPVALIAVIVLVAGVAGGALIALQSGPATEPSSTSPAPRAVPGPDAPAPAPAPAPVPVPVPVVEPDPDEPEPTPTPDPATDTATDTAKPPLPPADTVGRVQHLAFSIRGPKGEMTLTKLEGGEPRPSRGPKRATVRHIYFERGRAVITFSLPEVSDKVELVLHHQTPGESETLATIVVSLNGTRYGDPFEVPPRRTAEGETFDITRFVGEGANTLEIRLAEGSGTYVLKRLELHW